MFGRELACQRMEDGILFESCSEEGHWYGTPRFEKSAHVLIPMCRKHWHSCLVLLHIAIPHQLQIKIMYANCQTTSVCSGSLELVSQSDPLITCIHDGSHNYVLHFLQLFMHRRLNVKNGLSRTLCGVLSRDTNIY